MSNDEIKELIQLVVDSGIAELELQRGDNRVRIRRSIGTMHEITIPSTMTGHSPNSTDSIVQASQASTPSSIAATAPSAANEVIVKSPIVGTFYEGPKPGDPPFVKVGDLVEP